MVDRFPSLHVGVIPDGNRRFASWHGLTTDDGYRAGSSKAVDFIAWCLAAGIEQTTWYGSSALNVKRRSRAELIGIHRGVLEFCSAVRERFEGQVHVIGDVDGLPDFVPGREDLVRLARSPVPDDRRIVRVAVNYSAESGVRSPGIPPLDLIVRTGGQQRLSGFLPIESSFAELWFSDTLWPAFQHGEFLAALSWYARQERPFGE